MVGDVADMKIEILAWPKSRTVAVGSSVWLGGFFIGRCDSRRAHEAETSASTRPRLPSGFGTRSLRDAKDRHAFFLFRVDCTLRARSADALLPALHSAGR